MFPAASAIARNLKPEVNTRGRSAWHQWIPDDPPNVTGNDPMSSACMITLVMPPIEQPRSGQPRGQRGLRNSALMSIVNDLLAKLMYRALYKMHLQAVHGSAKTMLDTLAAIVTRSTEPRIKLH